MLITDNLILLNHNQPSAQTQLASTNLFRENVDDQHALNSVSLDITEDADLHVAVSDHGEVC